MKINPSFMLVWACEVVWGLFISPDYLILVKVGGNKKKKTSSTSDNNIKICDIDPLKDIWLSIVYYKT